MIRADETVEKIILADIRDGGTPRLVITIRSVDSSAYWAIKPPGHMPIGSVMPLLVIILFLEVPLI